MGINGYFHRSVRSPLGCFLAQAGFLNLARAVVSDGVGERAEGIAMGVSLSRRDAAESDDGSPEVVFGRRRRKTCWTGIREGEDETDERRVWRGGRRVKGGDPNEEHVG